MAAKIVVDTSVLITWFKASGEELWAEAHRLFEQTRSLPWVRHLSGVGSID